MQNGNGNTTIRNNKRIAYNASAILPDAPEGEWQATVVRGKSKVSVTKEGEGNPMVTFNFRLDTAETEDNATYQGTTLPKYISFVADNDGSIPAFAKRNTKMDLRALSAECGFDLAIIPDEMSLDVEELKAQLAPFIDAVEGKSFTIWTKHRDDRRNPGLKQVDVVLTRPGSSFGGGASSTLARAEDEDESGPESTTTTAKKSKKSRR